MLLGKFSKISDSWEITGILKLYISDSIFWHLQYCIMAMNMLDVYLKNQNASSILVFFVWAVLQMKISLYNSK